MQNSGNTPPQRAGKMGMIGLGSKGRNHTSIFTSAANVFLAFYTRSWSTMKTSWWSWREWLRVAEED